MANEIDDIFSSGRNKKGSGSIEEAVKNPGVSSEENPSKTAVKRKKAADLNELLQDVSKRKKKNKKKMKTASSHSEEKAVPIVRKGAEADVETVVFDTTKAPSKPEQKRVADDDGFGDSRGVQGGRKKTEEGYAIYSLDELKVGQEGGETPDCPFDCWCCF